VITATGALGRSTAHRFGACVWTREGPSPPSRRLRKAHLRRCTHPPAPRFRGDRLRHHIAFLVRPISGEDQRSRLRFRGVLLLQITIKVIEGDLGFHLAVDADEILIVANARAQDR
jgi:hypothetical protein